MSWPSFRLSEIADLCLGKMLDKKKNKGSFRPYLANINVRWGSLDLQVLREMPFEDRELERYGLRLGDIVMCEGGEPGRCVFWKDQVPGMMIQKALHRIRPSAKVDGKFLYYTLFHKGLSGGLDQYFTGATIKHLPGEQLAKVEVRLPPLAAQRRIASILGAYDDLIEVNRRRITVLEEMARGLFEEVIRDSQTSPKGDCPISEFVLKTLGGDWGEEEPDDEHTVEVRVVRGTDISKLQSGDFRSCPTRYIKSSSADKRLLKPYDVILENSINAKTRASGSTLVATPGMIEALGGSVIAASFCRVFQFRNPKDAAVFHMWCRHLHASGEIARYQVVAANGIANFQTTHFVRDCVLPFKPMHYQKQVEFLLRLIAPIYAQQIANLITSRDLLLPRLISGQLSVAEAERQLEEAA